MSHAQLLPALRRKIRAAIPSISEDEPVDLVFLASILCNFNPSRVSPHWLVIASASSAGTTRLVQTIQPWTRYVFTMVSGITPGFFFGSHRMNRVPPLERMRRDKKRILLTRNAVALTQVDGNIAPGVYSQLCDVFDGYLARETGTLAPRVYDPLPDERLGWIVAGSPYWYNFRSRHPDLGNRFSIYYFDADREAWNDPSRYRALDAVIAGDPAKVADELSRDVTTYLDAAIEGLDDGLRRVICEQVHGSRIATATKLVNRILSGGSREGDAGNRLYVKARELATMLAYMRGQALVSAVDVDVVVRFIFSQLRPGYQRFFRVVSRHDLAELHIARFIEEEGETVRLWTERLLELADLGIAQRLPDRGFGEGYRYKLSPEAEEMMKRISFPVPEEAPAPSAAMERMVAEVVEERGLVV